MKLVMTSKDNHYDNTNTTDNDDTYNSYNTRLVSAPEIARCRTGWGKMSALAIFYPL